MKKLLLFAACAVLTGGCNAQGVRSLADISIVDRDAGRVLAPYVYRGEYWVAGRAGARYAIEIRNRLGERLLAVTSVDGVNVLSGDTAAWDQTGYVFGPGEQYRVAGWRKSDSQIAAFTFADLADSYAARTGRPANVGIIGVALFRERQPDIAQRDLRESQPDAALNRSRLSALAAPSAVDSAASPAAPAAKLGTGHGEREVSWVSRTQFERLQREPNEVIRIHYDSFENLLALGIVKPQRRAQPGADPFPGSPSAGYVPDPPG